MLTKEYSPKHAALASLRFESACFNCGFDITLYLELDHHEAKSIVGEHRNFVLLCSRCNKAKGKLSPMEFYGDAEVIAELEYKLSLSFSDAEVMAEMSRLISLEFEFARKTKAKNQKLSTAAQRASQMKGIR